MLENHTVKENIFDKLIGYTDEVKEKRATKLLTLLELNFLKDTRAKYLSTGQKQRVAIARALAIIPSVLLLDEPFSNLDKLLTDKLFSFITKEVRKNKTAVILITHLPEEALKFADKIAVMDNGKIVQQGDKWKVYYHPKNSRLAGLLGTINTIHSVDLEKKKSKAKKRFFLRPDKILPATKSDFDLRLQIVHVSYNGKCFEILGETKNGNTLVVYTYKELQVGQEYLFSIAG